MKKEKMIIRKKVQKTFKNWKKSLTIGEELYLTEERLIIKYIIKVLLEKGKLWLECLKKLRIGLLDQ